jgi:hypothetical protein
VPGQHLVYLQRLEVCLFGHGSPSPSKKIPRDPHSGTTDPNASAQIRANMPKILSV